MSLRNERSASELEALVESVVLEQYNHYYRLAYSYVGQEDDAYDIVQNGVYKALKNAHKLREPEYVKTWVYRIMLNEVYAAIRDKKKVAPYAPLDEHLSSETKSMEDTYQNIDLRAAIDALPEQEKAIVLMKYFEGFKLEEISSILDENVNTIKSRLYRNMKKLRKNLEDKL